MTDQASASSPSHPDSSPDSSADSSTALSATARIAQELIRFPSVNWGEGRSDGETEAAQYVEAKLAALGLKPQLFEPEPGRVSVIARVDGSGSGTDALVVHGHLDVVPADPTNWTVDPFAGEIRDGMLWGRGAVDMKNMDAMILTALGEILGAGERPARDLVVAFFADEEAGGVRGSQWVVENHPHLFAGATEAISEVGGYSVSFGDQRSYLLQTGEKALIWIKLIARAPAAHGSRLIRDNAVTRLAEAVVALGREDWPIQLTDTTRQLLARVGEILGVDPEQVGPDELILRTGTAAGFILATLRVTTNPTGLTAGYKHNVIPEEASALIDIRCLPGEEEQTLARVRELIGPDVELQTMHTDIGLETPFDGPLVDTMVGLLQKHDPGATVLPYLMSGGTDNKALDQLGIRGYGFAPLQLPPDLDFPAMFHGVDERVPLAALDFGHRVLTELLRSY
ncbi:M20/M25/M40 family metallo-hydrolase [Naasia lichenicola]|uniref:M20/M25/M40 family metallo-hydrolase n=1 Tax=Naasia lichenicola TaxID=2565933 RepID=A0A4S4FSV2_9MICO|nr:M20/M25/M40 family metallo-hydrolase [Naasia lichenicola]THG33391.1 M20/M25/M40 family metallo-hydrolase [Naasia lichenicola]